MITQVLPLMFQYVLDIELVECEYNVHFDQYQIQNLENVDHLCMKKDYLHNEMF